MNTPTIFDSVDINQLKTIKVDELRKELKFRHLPDKGNKDELIDFLLADNERLVADNLQESIITSRFKQKEDQIKLLEMKQKIESKDNSTISIELLTQLVHTQKLISDNLSANNCNNKVQILSTNDTANAISLYHGKKHEDITDWILEVERISNHAHWTSSLTLVNAVSRLRGAALNWHKVSGRQLVSWPEWKDKITDRFKCKMSFSDFLKFQSKRVLRTDELIVDYIFDKDAFIEKAPFQMEQSDRVSLILEGINDNIWAIPLATARCQTVQELIDHAIPLDTIRKVNTTTSSLSSSYNQNTSNNTKASKETTKPIHRYNPTTDNKDEQLCFKCKTVGHISYDCPFADSVSKNRDSNKASNKNQKSTDIKHQTEKKKQDLTNSKSINCISTELVNISQIPVTINGSITIDALPDNGSCVTLLRKCFIPKDAVIHEWQDGPYATPEGDCTPSGWITLRIQVGKIDYTMP